MAIFEHSDYLITYNSAVDYIEREIMQGECLTYEQKMELQRLFKSTFNAGALWKASLGSQTKEKRLNALQGAYKANNSN